MDVQCERCKTEYDFDDALVSGRGTTVRCTHCGHQFKVRRPDVVDAAADRWVVEVAGGQTLTFLTLRELQRAILAKQVSRQDTLLLAGATRALGSITELDPFFEGRSSSRPPGPAKDAAALHVPAAAPTGQGRRTTQSFGAPPDRLQPLAPSLSAPVRESPRPVRTAPSLSPSPPPVEPPRPAAPAARSARPAANRDRSSYPPPSQDDAAEYRRRRRTGGWAVAFVLLVAVGVVAWVMAKPYLVARGAAAASQLDPRASAFLTEGERAMVDGNFEAAQEDFDKASVLAERNPRLLLDNARAAAAKADVLWLKLRLLPPDAVDETRTTQAELDERIARSTKAADDALAVGTGDPAAMRAKVDALRLAGDREAARGYISKVSGLAPMPETAYVLAALDLAEPDPYWATVIDRLRMAAAAEGNAGRARAALVYALAKSGDIAGARVELAKLDAVPRPYPCSSSLHAFVDRAPRKAPPASPGAAASVARASPGAPPSPMAPTPAGVVAAGPVAGDGVGDQASAMQAAARALKRGDYARARRLYEALVARNSSDSEALAGIGDVERAQGASRAAVTAYQRALAVNPSYMPAMLGVADTEWATGDRANARRAYKDIADRFPEGTYPPYVKTRAEAPPAAAPPGPSADTKVPDPGDGI